MRTSKLWKQEPYSCSMKFKLFQEIKKKQKITCHASINNFSSKIFILDSKKVLKGAILPKNPSFWARNWIFINLFSFRSFWDLNSRAMMTLWCFLAEWMLYVQNGSLKNPNGSKLDSVDPNWIHDPKFWKIDIIFEFSDPENPRPQKFSPKLLHFAVFAGWNHDWDHCASPDWTNPTLTWKWSKGILLAKGKDKTL